MTPPSDGAGHRGFGSTLLGGVLGSARGEECVLRFEPTGVSCRLVLGLAA